ncbi:MAG: DUF3810 domain-containing protein [Oscillospiraceae bacterium]|nr:DUF3810 domain-containing protein [Oscillospiraceae bacterium]
MKKYWKILLALILIAVAGNLAGCLPQFCDWYTDHIYCLIEGSLSRLTAPVPVAVGELLMYLGVVLVLFAVLFLILLLFLRKRQGFRRFCRGYYKSFLMTLVCVVFVYTFFWAIPFRGTVLGKGESNQRTAFTFDEVRALTLYAVNGVNAAAEEIEIAENGKVTFPAAEDNQPKIAAAMQALSGDYPRLNGYYPPVKTALCSDILERMHIGGYNYIYTMEPTRNKYIAPTYLPVLEAHELSHHKGYYKENEANFLSQLALSQSSDPYLRFSGFYDMFRYLQDSYLTAQDDLLTEMTAEGKLNLPEYHEDMSKEEFYAIAQARYKILVEICGEEPQLSERAGLIIDSAYQIEREIYNADSHPIDEMPAVQEAIQTTADTGWETQERILQENTYDGVTLLLLQYFDGKLY